MTREELAHVLRAAARITDDNDILVIGSQSILGTYWEDQLPEAAVQSMEADLAFLHDPDSSKAGKVDGAIGELSEFHELNAYYGQGVDVSTAVLPSGWRERVVPFDMQAAKPAKAVCLEVHDLVVSKLVAYREKDLDFAFALLEAKMVDAQLLSQRAQMLDPRHALAGRNVIAWVEASVKRLGRRALMGESSDS